MIKALIFDMDGLLIDSEPIWREAEQKIFSKVGILLDDAKCKETMGLRIDEVIAYWFAKHPWNNIAKDELQEEILEEVCRLINEKGRLLPGVLACLERAKEQNFKLAIASSSTFQVIHTVVEHFNLSHFFEVIHSAEFEAYGKPHPAVFIAASEKMNVSPAECLVFEDSFHGVVAALAAKMAVIAIPDAEQYNDPRFNAATATFQSLESWEAIENVIGKL